MSSSIHSVQLDWAFYLTAAALALALFFLAFSIRKYLGTTGEPELAPEEPEAAPAPDLPAPEEAPQEEVAPAPDPASRAEEFVKGLYDRLLSLDGRVKNIENDLSSGLNRDFTTKFLEDLIADLESLDKLTIRSRIEYLLKDIKK
ncbi:MAG: hypothetical protein NTY45_07560 [Elusimicrobia bacterium]|nr:hypothetical protein [Elusimicrobiota bacterium]